MAGSSVLGFSAGRYGLIVSARLWSEPWSKDALYRETLQATGRTTRILNRPKRVCIDAHPLGSMARTVARRECAPTSEPQARNLALFRHRGIFLSDVRCWDLDSCGRGATSR